MHVLGLVSRKGGSGKSTLTMHWAAYAARRGYRVVIVDMDPQGSSSRWFERREAEDVQLIASTAKQLRGNIKLCREAGIDLVIIDTTPDIARDALEAVRLSDLVVVPCQPSLLDLEAIARTVELIFDYGSSAAITLNRVDSRSRDSRDARRALQGYELPICPVEIHDRVVYRRAIISGETATEVERQEKAKAEVAKSWQWIEMQLGGLAHGTQTANAR